MVASLFLPRNDRAIESYQLGPASPYGMSHVGSFPRIVYAAAHVVADPLASHDPWSDCAIDWETTLAFRHHLWRLGFKIAEAMDTSQRGMGLDWSKAKELIRRSLAEANTVPGADLACGAGTDQIVTSEVRSLDEVVRAYEEQIGHVEAHGGRVILMASRALCRIARSADDYLAVYGRLISGCRNKVILHWLGAMFDPALAGYWGSREIETARPHRRPRRPDRRHQDLAAGAPPRGAHARPTAGRSQHVHR